MAISRKKIILALWSHSFFFRVLKSKPQEGKIPTVIDMKNIIYLQELVTDYNTKHARELFPHQEQHQRHLVKNSFIVELYEGQRKLRHLFLFNDVLVCAKYKASGGGSHPPTGGVAVGRHQEKFTFQLKWYIPLEHVSGFS